MKLAIDTSVMRRLPLDDALARAAEMGYSHVEVGLAHYSPKDASEEETRAFGRALQARGLGLAALNAICPVSYPEEEVRSAGRAQFEVAIKNVRLLGCGLIVSELTGDPERYAECSAAFAKSMSELTPALEEHGVTLCFEPHPGDFTERNKIAVDLIRDLHTDHVRYLYCIPHTFILGDNASQMIGYSKDVLEYVHLADTLRPERTFFSGRYTPKVQPHQHLSVGRGDVDMKMVFAALRSAGYGGFVTVNPFSVFDKPVDAARESKAAAEALMQSDS